MSDDAAPILFIQEQQRQAETPTPSIAPAPTEPQGHRLWPDHSGGRRRRPEAPRDD